MTTRSTLGIAKFARRLLPMLVSGLMLTACGSSPEEMVSSAKDYLKQNDVNAAIIQLKNALQSDADLAEARVLLGQIYYARGEFANAAKELDRASRLGVPEERLAAMLARSLVQQGESEAVLDRFASIKLSDPEAQSVLLAAIGDAQLRVRSGDAEQTFRAALSLDPDNAAASRGMALVEMQHGKPEAALAVLESAIVRTPDDSALHSLRGLILLSQDEKEAGLEALKKVVSLEPENQSAYLTLVTNLIRLGRFDEARGFVENLKSAVGESVVYSYSAAALNTVEGDLAKARDQIQEVVRKAPDFIPGRFLAGTIFHRLNDQLQAQANLNRVIEAVPENWSARRMLIRSYLAQRDGMRAVDAAEYLLRHAPEDGTNFSLAGQAYTLSGDFEKGAKFFERAATMEPDNSRALTRLGITRLAAGELEEGLATLAAASKADDSNASADFARVTTLLSAGRLDDALIAQKDLERKLPQSALSKNLRGGLMMASGDPTAAKAAFAQALELSPDFLPAAKNLARLYIAEGDEKAARSLFAGMAERNPTRVDIQTARVELEIHAKADKGKILAYFDQALRADPEAIPPRLKYVSYLLSVGDSRAALAAARDLKVMAPGDARVLGVLGAALTASGALEEAVSVYQAQVDRDRKNPKAYVDLALAQMKVKDDDSAIRSLEAAISIDETNIPAYQTYLPLLVRNGKAEIALGKVRNLQSLAPGLTYPHLGEAMVLRAQGKTEEAVVAVDRAFRLQPTTPIAVEKYRSLFANKQAKKALEFEKQWLADHPTDALFKAVAAEQALTDSRYKRADELYREIEKAVPNDVKILNNLAWIAHKIKSSDALAIGNRALSLAPDSPAVLDTVGVIEIGEGKVSSGLKKLERALELAPDASQIRFNLAEAYAGDNRPEEARAALEILIRDLPEGDALRHKAEVLKNAL